MCARFWAASPRSRGDASPICISSASVLCGSSRFLRSSCSGLRVPIAGGNWYRQLPPWLVRRAVEHWTRTYTTPYLMYFHVWELDPDPPKISAASWIQRVRTYRNLDRMPDRIREYLSRYRFTAVADHLGLAVQTQPPPLPKPTPLPAVPIVMPTARGEDERLPATIVIPCYNEELILPYLANTLPQRRGQAGKPVPPGVLVR